MERISRSFSLVAVLGVAAVTIFVVRGFAYYGQAVLLAASATDQRHVQKRMFDKLLRHNLGYFSDTHSSAHMAQVTYGCMGSHHFSICSLPPLDATSPVDRPRDRHGRMRIRSCPSSAFC